MGRHIRLTWVILLLLEWGGEGAALEITANDAANFLVGKDIILNIFYTSTSQSPIVTWAKDSRRVVIWGNTNYNVSQAYRGRLQLFGQGSLNITNASPTDSGTYTVTVVTLDEEDATKTFQVKIYEPVENVSVSSSPATVNERSPDVNLTCTVSRGEGAVRWDKDGNPLRGDSGYNLLDRSRTLQIMHPNTTHSGSYSCNISNPLSSGRGSYTLSVPSMLSAGAIAGIVIGSILGALLLTALLVLLVCCVRQKKHDKEKEPARLKNNGVPSNHAVFSAPLSQDDPAIFATDNRHKAQCSKPPNSPQKLHGTLV
ncbi:hypothetical protein FKM82_013034 [Ascaphus truei]